MYVCPECGHEWDKAAVAGNADEGPVYKDGNVLKDDDSVTSRC